MYSEKYLKTLNSCNVSDFFTRKALQRKLVSEKALKGHSKATWTLWYSKGIRDTQRVLRYLITGGNRRALRHSGTPRALGQKSVLKETEVGCFFLISSLYIRVGFGPSWCCTAFSNGCI